MPRRFDLPRAEEQLFEVEPGSRLLGKCHWQAGKRRDAPVLVIVHGLEGSSDSNYMLGVAWGLLKRLLLRVSTLCG